MKELKMKLFVGVTLYALIKIIFIISLNYYLEENIILQKSESNHHFYYYFFNNCDALEIRYL